MLFRFDRHTAQEYFLARRNDPTLFTLEPEWEPVSTGPDPELHAACMAIVRERQLHTQAQMEAFLVRFSTFVGYIRCPFREPDVDRTTFQTGYAFVDRGTLYLLLTPWWRPGGDPVAPYQLWRYGSEPYVAEQSSHISFRDSLLSLLLREPR
jgi:hypothetical protein